MCWRVPPPAFQWDDLSKLPCVLSKAQQFVDGVRGGRAHVPTIPCHTHHSLHLTIAIMRVLWKTSNQFSNTAHCQRFWLQAWLQFFQHPLIRNRALALLHAILTFPEDKRCYKSRVFITAALQAMCEPSVPSAPAARLARLWESRKRYRARWHDCITALLLDNVWENWDVLHAFGEVGVPANASAMQLLWERGSFRCRCAALLYWPNASFGVVVRWLRGQGVLRAEHTGLPSGIHPDHRWHARCARCYIAQLEGACRSKWYTVETHQAVMDRFKARWERGGTLAYTYDRRMHQFALVFFYAEGLRRWYARRCIQTWLLKIIQQRRTA